MDASHPVSADEALPTAPVAFGYGGTCVAGGVDKAVAVVD